VTQTVKITREHKPNKNNQKIYDAQYKTYREIYENLKDIMGVKNL